jgi:hypothetical protein
MQEVVRPKPVAPPPPFIPPDVGAQTAFKWARRLIWTYLVLLVFEGALRKWIVPRFSDPLLVIRDPVVIAIYLCAFRARIFPRNIFITSLAILAGLCWAISVVVLLPYLSHKTIFLVTAYGFRSNFLHLPLIFVIANVFEFEDVKKMGWWILVCLIPLTLLMAVQFRSSPDSFVNRTAGLGEGEQITAGGGKIRPPATFSFISGVVFYLSSAAAFLVYGLISERTYKTWLLAAAGLSLIIGTAISGSRSVVASVGLVVLSLLLVLILRPESVNRFGRSLLLVVLAAWVVSYIPIFKEGLGILSGRFTDSAEAAQTSIGAGMFERIFTDFVQGFRVFDRLPFFGFGLGIGTNAGCKFINGQSGFLLGEAEWSRVLLESGPFFGTLFLLWRLALVVRMFWLSLRALGFGETLAIVLFSASFVPLLIGQFGQPTILGFAVFFSGLCLVSTKIDTVKSRPQRGKFIPPPPGPVAKVRGRSFYAEYLHGEKSEPPKSNGSADR